MPLLLTVFALVRKICLHYYHLGHYGNFGTSQVSTQFDFLVVEKEKKSNLTAVSHAKPNL